ncbi:hypothetical protein TNIN_393621 [Trichonephila inaurata madagascariensis]|uniref:Uncharacterized protein n=1 Tax=Trichonephila inaurata madagascariensis TaxID=2747483 RepID=A0A8X7CD73_9ARAC|nr:hypothetical protein TNIN_393621 [Trichonephila inaurata madagascariensis]
MSYFIRAETSVFPFHPLNILYLEIIVDQMRFKWTNVIYNNELAASCGLIENPNTEFSNFNPYLQQSRWLSATSAALYTRSLISRLSIAKLITSIKCHFYDVGGEENHILLVCSVY